eukprot:10514775-Alexandrium_andersonii.AAC.1
MRLLRRQRAPPVACLRRPSDGRLSFAPVDVDAALRGAWEHAFEQPGGPAADCILSQLWQLCTDGLRHASPEFPLPPLSASSYAET